MALLSHKSILAAVLLVVLVTMVTGQLSGDSRLKDLIRRRRLAKMMMNYRAAPKLTKVRPLAPVAPVLPLAPVAPVVGSLRRNRLLTARRPRLAKMFGRYLVLSEMKKRGLFSPKPAGAVPVKVSKPQLKPWMKYLILKRVMENSKKLGLPRLDRTLAQKLLLSKVISRGNPWIRFLMLKRIKDNMIKDATPLVDNKDNDDS